MLKIVLISVFLIGSLGFAQDPITAQEVLGHIKVLASDRLEGRRAGTPQADIAARYIAAEFKKYGLTPAGDNGGFLQKFEIVTKLELGEKNHLNFADGGKNLEMAVDTDWRPLGFSASNPVDAELAFVGYGVSDEGNYDEYENIDVNGRVAVMFRYVPQWDSTENDLSRMAALRFKAINAREHGAVAAVIITGPEDADNGDLITLNYDNNFSDAGIPVVSLSRAAAEKIFAANGVNMEQAQSELNAEKKVKSTLWEKGRLALLTDVREIRKPTYNVIGVLEGRHPRLKNEYIVIGAHYDHLGLGGPGSLAGSYGEPHNGADDNASGTSGMLELAEYFASAPAHPNHSVIFMAFSGEEEGLLGSAYYAANPVKALDQTTTMINMDMIGRLKDMKLTVYGMGTSPGWKDLVEKNNADYGFRFTFNNEGFGPSDHSSFYAKEIPVLFFFTGIHGDYHRPSDDWEKINAGGEEMVLNFVRDIIVDLDNKVARPVYAEAKSENKGRQGGGGRRAKVYIGTIPDFGESDGYKLSGVNDGSPAAKAGLKGGDVIVKFAGKDVANIYDFMYAMQKCKVGKAVEVVVKRNGEEVTTSLIPASPKEKPKKD